MNAGRLLAQYERIADAPDAIKRLRHFILDLAVRGKLVPQDANDESASELLKRIAMEKTRLVKAGEIKPPKPIPARSEPPFPIPAKWRWSQLAEIGVLSPRNEAADTLEASFVPMPLIAAEYGIANEHEVRAWGEIKKGYTHFAEGDVGLAKITPCFENGKSTVFRNLTGGIGSGTTELHIVRPLFVKQDYILLFLKSPHFIETGIPKMTGTAGQKRVPTEYFAHSPFPLPPLAEQHRIIAKVDELMGLCDRLEASRAGREAVRDRLAAASLARLNAPDPETFPAEARFALDVLPALTTRPDQIKQLRQTILNLAIRGKLVPQNPNDEAASELLVDISKTRKNLYLEKKIPKPKQLPSIDGIELPFAVPSGWAWSMLGDLCYQVSDGPHFSPQYVAPEQGVPFLSTRNIRPNGFDLSTIKYVSRADHDEFCKRVRPEKDDIIYTKGGTTGIAKVNDLDFEFSVWVHLAILRIEKKRLLPRYVEMSLNSPHCYEQSQRYTQGISNFDLGLTRMIKITIPLPPLAEQHRIVAKVDALMALCDRLEASLTATATTRRRLLDALLAEALAPSEDRELEAAE